MMEHKIGEKIVVEEDGNYWPLFNSPRRPQRLCFQVKVTWMDSDHLYIDLPARRVTLEDRKVQLPKHKIKLPRHSEELHWQEGELKKGPARQWRGYPFYPSLRDQTWANAEKANYFRLALWRSFQAHIRSDGESPVAFEKTNATTNAHQLLELEIGADRDAILKAFRAKAMTTHPDQGGSIDAFRAVLAARDQLLPEG